MPKFPQPEPQELITGIPDHLRLDAGEIHADEEQVQHDLGVRAAGEVVTVPDRLPRVVYTEDQVTPEMRRNALGAPDDLDAAGRQVPRIVDALDNLGTVGNLPSIHEGTEK